MRILIAHNSYGNFGTGGERVCAQADVELLRRHGHEVYLYERTNSEARNFTWKQWATLPWTLTYSKEAYRHATKVFKEFKPDVVHVHNYKFIFTPAIFQAAKDLGIKTVMTSHGYRLVCACGLLCRNYQPCTKCLDGFPLRILWNNCTPWSFPKRCFQLLFYLGTKKRLVKTDLVDAFITLTPFAKGLNERVGVPKDRLYVRPNYLNVDDLAGLPTDQLSPKKGAVAIGRLSKEKGIDILLDAWKDIDYPLTLIGDGPLREELEARALPNVKFLGFVPRKEALERLASSAFLVFPSVCYEGFPLSVLESMSLGVPAVASNIGARADLVRDGQSGLLFENKNADDLTKKVKEMIADPKRIEQMGKEARRLYEENYTPEVAYQILIDIYEKILAK